ncbi:MAG: hypothetical protein ACYCQI_12890 [Gammaproteobacteria bacterium]
MQTRESKITDVRTPYKKMHDELTALTDTYQIKLDRAHFFEDMILKLAEIKEVSSNSDFGESKTKPGFVYFDFEFSKEAGLQLVQTLNSQFPSLMAVDDTDLFEMLNGGKVNTIGRFGGKPARLIYMRTDAIIEHLLPRIADYMQAHPEIAASYVRYSFNELLNKVDAELAKYGISCRRTDCFEETICALVNRYFNSSARVSSFFQTKFPDDAKPYPDGVLDMTLNYLGVKTSKPKEDDVYLITIDSRFQPNSDDQWKTDFYLTTDIVQAKKIEAYFNRLEPNSALLSSKPELLADKKAHFTRISIANSALMDEKFWILFNDTMQSYSKEKIERYRKQSKSINRTMSDCLSGFEEVDKIILVLCRNRDLSQNERLIAMKVLMYLRDLEAQIRVENKNVEFDPLITEKALSPELTACVDNVKKHLELLKSTQSSNPVVSTFFEKDAEVINQLINDISDLVTNKVHLPPVRSIVPEARRCEFGTGQFIARC